MPIDTIRVPDTVQTVISARIDRLEHDAKRLLQVAAVIGTDVPRRASASASWSTTKHKSGRAIGSGLTGKCRTRIECRYGYGRIGRFA